MQKAKSIFSSKTFWLAVLQGAAGVSVIFATSYPGVGWIVFVKSVVDIALRYVTSTPIGAANTQV